MVKAWNVLTVALELDCGATRFTGSSGNISLPRSPNDHFVTVNCTYTISTDPTNIVFLNHSYTAMARFVQSFQCCEGESLMVRYLHFSLIFVTRKLVAGRGGSVVGFGAFPSGRLQPSCRDLGQALHLQVPVFIHSGHFYSAPSSPLLLRGAPAYSTDTVSEFHAEAHRQLQVKDLPRSLHGS